MTESADHFNYVEKRLSKERKYSPQQCQDRMLMRRRSDEEIPSQTEINSATYQDITCDGISAIEGS